MNIQAGFVRKSEHTSRKNLSVSDNDKNICVQRREFIYSLADSLGLQHWHTCGECPHFDLRGREHLLASHGFVRL